MTENPGHLTASQLAAAARNIADLPTADRTHLIRCAECRRFVEGPVTEHDTDDDLDQAAETAAAQTQGAVSSNLTSPPPTTATPAAGELWRLLRGNIADLAVLLDSTDTSIDAVPVTVDEHLATASTIVIDAAQNPLGVHLVVWLDLMTPVPFAVCERPVAKLPTDTIEVIRSGITATRTRAVDPGTILDDRSQYGSLVAERFAWLASDTPPRETDGYRDAATAETERQRRR
jgi:hypothetical protein